MYDNKKWVKIKMDELRKDINSFDWDGEILESRFSDFSARYNVHKKNYLLYNRAYNRTMNGDAAEAYRQLNNLDSTFGFTQSGHDITAAYKEVEKHRYTYDNWRKTVANTIRNDNQILDEIIDYLKKAKDEISNMATHTEFVYDRRENIKELILLIESVNYVNRQNIYRVGKE
ncbi:MAG: hypothetical protein Q4E39_01200 [bacterium]|nr:hypothetical protein [bacterium]